MAHLKTNIVEVKTETNCLAHALIIAIAKLTNDIDYKAYRQGRKIYHKVDRLNATTEISLDSGGITEPECFQDDFRQYKIVVYTGLNCEEIKFEGRVETSETLNLLYD